MKRTYTPDPKPAPRPRKQTRVIDKDATKRARLAHPSCVICGDLATNSHHVLARSQGGDDVPACLASLCGSGTSGCHGLIEANDEAARRALGEHLVLARQDTLEYVRSKFGVVAGNDWLARRLFIT